MWWDEELVTVRERYAVDGGRMQRRNQLDADALAGDLRVVVATTVQPARVSVWLRDGGGPP